MLFVIQKVYNIHIFILINFATRPNIKLLLGTGEKNPIMESHLYTCMGSLALTHNFTWSRWNLLSGRRSCILLMREMIENRKLVNCKINM